MKTPEPSSRASDPSSLFAPEALAFVRDPAQARSLLDPLRRSILDALSEPGSASTVARALGLARQRVNYHVRELEGEGLLRHVEDRRRGNCVERMVRASARRYVVDPQVVEPRPVEALATPGAPIGAPGAHGASSGSPGAREGTGRQDPSDPFSTEELLLAASRSLREVGELRHGAAQTGRRVPTLTLETRIRFGSPREEVEFAQAVHEAFTRLTEHYDRPEASGSRLFRITLAGHPVAEGAGKGGTGSERNGPTDAERLP